MSSSTLADGGFTFTSTDMLGSTACVDTARFCASGTTAAGDTAGTVWGVLVGVNLNQADLANATPNQYPIPSTSTGIYYQVSQRPLQGLRIQTNDAAGTNYCVVLTSTQGLIPWTAFNTSCWSPTLGTYMSGPPIDSRNIAFIVPSIVGGVAQAFNFCIDGLQYQ